MSDDEDNTVVLFTGHNTRLTQFAAPRHGDHDSPPPPQARVKETLVASGTLVIYKMLGREKAAFIRCGSFVHPILPKSRMWRTSSDEFVLPQPIPGKYYRVQLLAPGDDTRQEAKKSTQNSAAELERVFKDSCRYRNAISSRKRHTFAVRSSSPDTFPIPQLRHVSDSRLHKPVSTPLLRVESDSEESQSDSCHSLDRLQEQDSEDNEYQEQDKVEIPEQDEQPNRDQDVQLNQQEQDHDQLHNEQKDEHNEQHEQPQPQQQEQDKTSAPPSGRASGIESPSTDYSSSASTLDRILESFPQSFPYLQPTGPSSVGEQPIAEVDPSVKSSSTSAMSLSSSASSGATSNTSVLEERPPPFVGPLAPTTSYLSHPLVPLATRNNILSSTFPLRFNPMDDDWLESSPQASPSTPRTSTVRASSNQSPRTPVQGSFQSYTVSSSSLSPPPRTPSPFSGSPRPPSQRSRRRSNRSERSERSVLIADSPRKYKGLMNSPGSTSPPTIGTSASEAVAYVSRPRQEHEQTTQPDFYHQAVTVTGYVGRKLWNRLSWAPRDDS
uniref:Inheritance of peroxisomes protein 1 n=1 Tax=Blastobotrys adeninivorans TaxID=409370 RepID=A0A060T9Y8_BLAAD